MQSIAGRVGHESKFLFGVRQMIERDVKGVNQKRRKMCDCLEIETPICI